MKPVVYVRVSSDLQAQANGCDSQRAAIHGWAKGQGLDPAPIPEYEDSGVSGKSMDRPEWNRMMEGVRAGTYDTVILYDLSRAGRTLRGLLEWVEEMVRLRVRVVFIKDQLDLSTAMGQLILSIMGAVAQFERARTADKIRDGVRARIAKGGTWGPKGRVSQAQWEESAKRIMSGASRPSDEVRRLGVQPEYAYRRLKALRTRMAG